MSGDISYLYRFHTYLNYAFLETIQKYAKYRHHKSTLDVCG